MLTKYPPRKTPHSPSCWCNKCFKRKRIKKIKGKRLDYFEYINSPLWEKRKREYYAKHKKICMACGSDKRIQLHHLEYASYGNEPDYALASLCRPCHEEFHSKHDTRHNMVKATLLFIKDKQDKLRKILHR